MGVHVCVKYNALESLLVLLQKGAAVNRKPNGKTPLHVACEVSQADCVALLLDHGARINSKSLSGHTALHYCITRDSVDCAKQLLFRGQRSTMGRGGGFILGLLQPPFPLSPGERWVHTAVIYSRERRELLRPSNMYYFHTHCT